MEPQNRWDRLTPAQKFIAEAAGCAVVLVMLNGAAAAASPLGDMLVNFLHWLAASLH